MRFTSVLAGTVALVVAMVLLSYVTNPMRSGETAPPVVETGEPPKEPDSEGNYPANPLTPADAKAAPVVDIAETDYRFGRMAAGASGEHTFVIRNTGVAPLELRKGPSTCKCTVGKIGQEQVPPGETVEVKMKWEPPSASMEFLQSATIWTNDPQRPQLSLTISGEVVPDVMRYPEGTWTAGPVSEGAPKRIEGMMASMLKEDFEITAFESPVPWIKVEATPMTEEELKGFSGKAGYKLLCVIEPQMPIGRFRELVKLKTNLRDHEEFEIEVTGSRLGPLNFVGPGWFGEQHVLKLGRLSAAGGRKVPLSLFGVEEEGQPLEVTVESVEPPVLEVDVSRRNPGDASSRRVQFVLTIDIPAGVTPGRYTEDKKVAVNLSTTHPAAPAITFYVEFQAD